MSWQDRCAEFVRREGLDPACLRVLEAFGGIATGPTPTLGALEVDPVALCARIVEVLEREVDRDQSELFARRFLACAQLLAGLGRAEARVLRIGLLTRTWEILEAPGPHALRVRACVDFYTSHGALLHHAEPGLPSLTELQPAWRPVAQEVEHALLEAGTDRGPVHVNLLRVGEAPLEVVDLRGGSGDFARDVEDRGAVAGVSGGFFLYSEPDIEPPFSRGEPVGLLADRSGVVSPPIFRRATLDADDRRLIPVTLVGWELLGHRIEAVNELVDGAALLNRAFGNHAPAGRTSVAIAHDRVLSVHRDGCPIPLNGCVLSLKEGRPEGAVRWPDWTNRISGGPWLLRDGVCALDLDAEDFAMQAPPITFSQDETFDQNLLPRMGVGWMPDGRLIFAAVDGRNFERAPGLTLRGVAELLRGLGCAEAMNLDGGSSKRMVVEGRVVDLATTELVQSATSARSRPVRNGILVLRPRP